MNTKKIIAILLIGIYTLSSCGHKPTSNQNEAKKLVITKAPLIKLFSVGGNNYVALDTLKFPIPKNVNIDSLNLYNGIYEIKGNDFKRSKSFLIDNFAFLSTSEDLGKGIRSYLYVFDIKNKSLIKDSIFKRNFLYSSAGIFIVDRISHRIFSVDKPEWYAAKQTNIVPASIFYVKDGHFENLRNVYKVGGEIPTDTSLISFYHKSMSAKSNDVLVLPNNWWKNNK